MHTKQYPILTTYILIFFTLLTQVKAQSAEDENLSSLISFDGEPSIAINPANNNNIIAGWMRLRLDGKVWIATTSSFDNGKTWSPIQFMPHDTVINGSADVCIAFHKSGIAYLSYVNYRLSPDSAGGIFLSKSSDGGLHWNAPKKMIDIKEKPGYPVDRPWISVDNSGGIYDGRVYITSMSYYQYKGKHHVYLKNTDDGGETLSPIYQVDDNAFSPGILTISYAPVSVGADGRVYIAFMSYDLNASLNLRMYVATSADGGQTFSKNVMGNIYPEYFKLPAYSLAADPLHVSNAIISWCDTRFGDLDVLMSKTTDAGKSWTLPVRVNDDSKANNIAQDQVWSAYSPTGKFAIAWRDRRNNDTSKTSPFDIYAAISADGGNTFFANTRLSSLSSASPSVGCCNSFIGLALTDSTLVTNWGGNRNNDWDVFMNKFNFNKLTKTDDIILSDKYDMQIFPNPSATGSFLKFTVNKTQKINIKLLSSKDEIIRNLVNKEFTPGSYNITLNTDELPAGIYYILISDNNNILSKKMIIMK